MPGILLQHYSRS